MIRFFDILFSLVGFILMIPIIIILSLLIKLESKGSIFFKQERIGKNGIVFKLIKFRSMYVNSDKKGLITVGANDSRITRVGYFIRNYKLDELPQLINVIKGDMSIVGPRPEVKKYVDLYNDEQARILIVKPGITDYASIFFRNENEMLAKSKDPEQLYIKYALPRKIRLNFIYIKNKNICLYFHIIFLTLYKICCKS
jgi:lipopolysaccharide/colanic/teichoic acid biosynthesis glycosyltransferase